MTPGNPLKDANELAPLAERLARCEAIKSDPRMIISALESSLPTTYTANTLEHLTMRRPDIRFVWVMGADNLGQFHRWQNWQGIASMMPIAVIDRPGSTMALHSARAAQRLSHYRIDEGDAPCLASMKPPAWVFLHGPRSSLSSTQIRNKLRKSDAK